MNKMYRSSSPSLGPQSNHTGPGCVPGRIRAADGKPGAPIEYGNAATSSRLGPAPRVLIGGAVPRRVAVCRRDGGLHGGRERERDGGASTVAPSMAASL